MTPQAALFTFTAKPPTLRPYQEQALTAITVTREEGLGKALLVLATGGGKTIVFSELIRRWNVPTLILAHREELLAQARDKLRMVWPDADIGLIGGGYNDHPHHFVTIASVGTLVKAHRLQHFAPPRLGLVVVDEAHHTAASTYRKILQGVGIGHDGAPFLLGVTATPQRADGKSLTPLFGHPVFHANLVDLVRAGYLCNLQGLQVKTSTLLDKVEIGKDGDFTEDSLGEATNTPERNRVIVDAYQKHAADRPTIVFAVNVEHAHTLASLFRARGISAAALDGETHPDERKRILRDFTSGKLQVICNCMVLTEGFDEPGVSCLILARPTQSRSLYIQCVGRGARTAPGKHDCLIIDITDNSSKHSLNLMQLPKLTGREDYDAVATTPKDEDEDIPSKRFDLRSALDQELKTTSTLERAVELFADAFTWERQGSNYTLKIALPPPHSGHADLHLDFYETGYRPRLVTEDGHSQMLTSDPLALDWAQLVAEDAAASIVRGNMVLVDRRAPWRQHGATPKQLSMLKAMGIKHQKGVSKGEASDLITAAMAKQSREKGRV